MKIQLSDHFDFKKLFRFTVPTVLMMVFTSIYGVVDGFFVSNFAGKTPFAAINLIMPFVMVIGGMGFMIGTGGTALVSKVLGEGDRKKANEFFTMMIIVVLIVAAVVSALGIAFIRPVAKFLGADEQMMGYCVLYGRIVIGFSAAFMLQNVFQSFLIAAEKPKLGLITILAAGCTNMALDALFVGGFKWGVVGAAVATGLSECVGGFIPLIYFICPNKSLLRVVKTKLDFKAIMQACGNGSSELMSNVSSSIVGMLYNIQLGRLAGENGIAAYGVLMYVQFVFIAIFIGYSIGVAPIIGYNYGAQNFNELKSMRKKSMLIMGVLGVVLATIAFCFARPLAKIFVSYDAELLDLTVHAFKIYAIHFLLCGFNIFASSFFTALNNGGVSAAISFLRTLVFQTAAVIVMPIIFGVNGIWWAVVVAEVCAFIISTAFMIVKRKKYNY